jgi:hypothetical protein
MIDRIPQYTQALYTALGEKADCPLPFEKEDLERLLYLVGHNIAARSEANTPDVRKAIKIAKIYVDLDGCEGGDFIRMICNTLEHSQDGHGYAMSGDTQNHLYAALQSEVEAQAASLEAEPLPWNDDETIAEAKREIERIQSSK